MKKAIPGGLIDILKCIWQQVFLLESLDDQDNFFALGGNSFMALQIVQQVNEKISVSLPLSTLFKFPTIKQLASHIDDYSDGKVNRPVIRIAMPESPSVFPLSAIQRQIYFLCHRVEKAKIAYQVPMLFEVQGELDLMRLEKSINWIASRHPIYRTFFKQEGAQVHQCLGSEPVTLKVQVCKMESFKQEAIVRQLKLACQEVIAVNTFPLLKVLFFPLTEKQAFLLVIHHHLITDAWSMRLFNEALQYAYAEFSKADCPAFSGQNVVDYYYFVDSQQRYMNSSRFEQDKQFWIKNLDKALDSTFPADYKRPLKKSFQGKRISLLLDSTLMTLLEAFNSKYKTTPFMLIASVLSLLLCRYNAQNEASIGFPFSQRSDPNSKATLGVFLNTVVLRTSLVEGDDFLSFLARLRESCLDTYSHAAFPFDQLVHELKLPPSLNKNPLFQVMLVWQDKLDLYPFNLGAAKFTPRSIDTGTSKFDLTLECHQAPGGILMTMEYDVALYRLETAQRLLKQIKISLLYLLKHPEQQLASFNLMSKKVLHACLKKLTQYSTLPGLHRYVEMHAAHTPEAMALITPSANLTYAQLNHQANQLANYLRQSYPAFWRLPQNQRLIGIALSRNLSLLVALLAILKSGGVYVPVDPQWPEKRVAFVLDNADCQLLLTEKSVSSLWKLPDIPHLFLDESASAFSNMPQDNLSVETSPSDWCYIIYTSGTSGVPKGVSQTHYHVMRLLEVCADLFVFKPTDVWTLFHSVAFDFSVWEIWGAWRFGSALLVPSFEETRDPARFYDLIKTHAVTVLNQTPSAFRLFMAEEQQRQSSFLALRYVIFGGEALDVSMLAAWWETHHETQPQLVNMYGTTETTVHASYYFLSARDLNSRVRSPVGLPLPDQRAIIVDTTLQPVSAGIPGELLLGGQGLSPGYYKLNAMTEEKFIPLTAIFPDASHELQSERFYRTGDLMRQLSDGSLEYLGRIDRQLKLHGFRIEAGEIEQQLNQYPFISHSVVKHAVDDNQVYLVAYYTVRKNMSDEAVDEASLARQLKLHLAQILPDYMIPHYFVLLEQFPLTNNGKVDEAALSMPTLLSENKLDMGNTLTQTNLTYPQRVLLSLWYDLLKQAAIEIDDNFFSLGGDSMSSVILVNAARKQGFSFSVSDVFKTPTIRQLVSYYRTGLLSETSQETALPVFDKNQQTVFPAENIEAIYPLTSLQIGMIYHSDLQPEEGIYLDCFAYYITMNYDSLRFANALSQLIDQHPVLRTACLMNTFKEPVQVVLKSVKLPIEEEDYRHLSSSTQEAGMACWRESQRRTPFIYERAPLFRIKIFVLSEKTIALQIAFHHLILDGWSVATWITQLLKLNADLEMEQDKFRGSNTDWNFRDYVASERWSRLSQESKQFWEQELMDSKSCDFPATPPKQLASRRFQSIVQVLPEALIKSLSEISKSWQVSLDAIMLAVYLKLLCWFGGNEDMTCGVVFNDRPSLPEIENTLGLFLNTLPFRCNLSSAVNQSWKRLVLSVFEKKRMIYPHRHYPLAQILEDNGNADLFNHIFYFTHFHVYETLEGIDTCCVKSQLVDEKTNFPWAFHCGPQLGKKTWGLTINYDQHRYDEGFVTQWLQCYFHLLEQVARDPDADHRVYQWSVLEQACLSHWNATATKNELKSVPHLIDELACQIPDKIALAGENETYTYRLLSQRSNQLACDLLNYRHADKDFLVGLCVERKAFAVVAMLAIFKAGGVYVPLDPTCPKARVQWILENTRTNLLITEPSVLAQMNYLPDIPMLDLSQYANRASNEKTHFNDNLLPVIKTTELAYIIHTSGSTGTPKGVMVSHAALSNVLSAVKAEISVTDDEKLLALTTFTFDISLLELFLPLISGSCCVVAPQPVNKDPVWISAALKRYDITLLQATPTLWELLFEHQALESVKICKAFKMLCGGETLSANLAKKLLSLTPLVWNVYGPTETTIWSTIYSLESGKLHPRPPIGKPLANTRLYVLDNQQKPLPLGAIGQLYIAGTGLAQGYFGQAALTQQRFIRGSGELSNEILYDSGDLARWLPDGVLDYHGRSDDQIKIRGFRIEPREIEVVLAAHPMISHCGVLLKPVDESGESSLVAFLVKSDWENHLPVRSLRHLLTSRLPNYLLPDEYVFVDRLPMTSNGKLDRQTLLSMYKKPNSCRNIADKQSSVSQTLFSSSESRQLLSLWQSVLHIDTVLADDDFFDLGGQSILALRLVNQINQAFRVNLSLKELIEHSVFADLLACLLEKKLATPSIGRKQFLSYQGQAIPDPVVTLKGRGKSSPVFLIHPVGGNVFYYLPFVRQLPNDSPVYAIQDPGLLLRTPLFSSLSDMAAFYIQVILKYQPSGPYYLAGSSFGANAVVEMTRQLLDSNKIVAFAGLIDGWPRYPVEANENKEWFCQNLLQQINKMHDFFSATDVPELFLDLHWHRQQLLVKHELPDLSDTKLTLFKAKETMPVLQPLDSPYNNWDTACNTVPTVFDVPGDHFTMHFPPNHEALAQAFTSALVHDKMAVSDESLV